ESSAVLVMVSGLACSAGAPRGWARRARRRSPKLVSIVTVVTEPLRGLHGSGHGYTTAATGAIPAQAGMQGEPMSPEVQASTQRDRRAWARRHNHALASLARRVWQDDCGLEDASALICETAAETLEVERVNVWRHDPDARLLDCLHHYERKGARHRRPCDLQLRVDGGYSQALAEVRVMNLSMVERDGNDDAMAQYLREHRIGSLLDAPVRSAGELLGVICHEHVGPPRVWSPEDQAFA